MPPAGVLILTRSEVARLLDLDDCIAVVESAFRAHGDRTAAAPGALGHHVDGGAFHVKAASLTLGRRYFAAKTNGNFFANERAGLPRIQGIILLCDATHGTPLAVMDSIEITILRTAAATAVAARHLARTDARTAVVAGCGLQGHAHVRAISRVRPIVTFRVYDTAPAAAHRLATDLAAEVEAHIEVTESLAAAAREAQIVVTCTPSREPLLASADIAPGTFVAGVGADSEDKQELAPDLLAKSTVVTDVIEQSATFGDLAHAIRAGAMRREDVYAELGDVVAGTRPGRRLPDERIVFDSTGTALQDVAAAALVYERALERGVGTRVAISQ